MFVNFSDLNEFVSLIQYTIASTYDKSSNISIIKMNDIYILTDKTKIKNKKISNVTIAVTLIA